MKRFALILSALAAAAALAGCNTVTPDQLNTTLAQAATLIANGCKVVQPTVSGVATITGDAAVSTAAAANGVFCAANTAAAASNAGAATAASAVAATPASAPQQ